jgi:crotonobetainyl-CoA:carnitine CoA-transferase CaiB-like acyl-CoA transferase
MTATFGPQLVGQTEKTLQALLRRALADTGLDERQWVALRLADRADGDTLRARLADQARFDDAEELATQLEQRGLVAGDAPTVEGRALLESVLATSAALSGPIWDDIEDADAAARALTVVLTRARAALSADAEPGTGDELRATLN